MSKHNYSQHYNKPKNRNASHSNPVEKPKTVEVKMESNPIVQSSLVTAPDVVQPKPQLAQETSQVVRPSLVNETIETKSIPTSVEGIVTGCAKLNVRAEPNLFAEVVYVLDTMSEIMIDVNKSDRDWFYICTATGIEGYCMRKYVEAHL